MLFFWLSLMKRLGKTVISSSLRQNQNFDNDSLLMGNKHFRVILAFFIFGYRLEYVYGGDFVLKKFVSWNKQLNVSKVGTKSTPKQVQQKILMIEIRTVCKKDCLCHVWRRIWRNRSWVKNLVKEGINLTQKSFELQKTWSVTGRNAEIQVGLL